MSSDSCAYTLMDVAKAVTAFNIHVKECRPMPPCKTVVMLSVKSIGDFLTAVSTCRYGMYKYCIRCDGQEFEIR